MSQQRSPVDYAAQSPEALELRRAQKDPATLLTHAATVRRQFIRGGWLLGGWIGLVLGAKLISLSVRRHRTDFEPDRGACLSCARCFEYCPNERVRRGLLPAEALQQYTSPPPAAPNRSEASAAAETRGRSG